MDDKDHTVEIHRKIHLGRLVGEGGMGQIFEGFEPGVGSHAAVKLLRKELLDDTEVRERFDEEARIMASIQHPGVLPIYGWGTDPHGRPFYAMKKISGDTLTELFTQRDDQAKSIVWRRRLLHIFQSVCDTVGYAHEQGIIHRDLKPDNIMIDPFGSIYVIDWGIAKHLTKEETNNSQPRTLVGAVMGSPGYMSPEQADGKTAKVGPEADVFALGVILYQILTGSPPFEGATDREAMLHTINANPDSPRRKNFFLSRSISMVCMKALHKEPSRRYRNASDLANEIHAYLEGRAVKIIHPTPIERASFWTRREPVRAALTWAACFAILSGLSVLAFQTWIDHRLADKTWATVQVLDADVVELQNEIRALSADLPIKTDSEKTALTQEINLLKTRMILRRFQALNAVRSVSSLRFMRSDPKLNDNAVERLILLIESDTHGQHALLLNALTAGVLEDIEEGKTSLTFSRLDLQRLKNLQQKTSEASRLRP